MGREGGAERVHWNRRLKRKGGGDVEKRVNWGWED